MVAGTVTLLSSYKLNMTQIMAATSRISREGGRVTSFILVFALSDSEVTKRAVSKRNTNDWVLGGYYWDPEVPVCSALCNYLYFVSPWPWSIEVLMAVSASGLCLSLAMIKCRCEPACHTHSDTGREGQDCQIQILGPSTVFYDLISQT